MRQSISFWLIALACVAPSIGLAIHAYLMYRESTRKLGPNECPLCRKGYLHPIRSQFMKKCGSCSHEVKWDLKDGQRPLVSSHRDKRK